MLEKVVLNGEDVRLNSQRDVSAVAPPGDQAVPVAMDEYLREWEERRERGEQVSPTDLCRDRPEDLAELARLIGMLEECDRILATSGTPPTPQEDGADPTAVAGYEVRGKLGRGGMGKVYRVWDPVLRREAALKVLQLTGLATLPDEVAHLARRFQQEAQVLAQLKHEHIVPVYEAGVDNGRPYFVMECVPGGSLVPRLPEMTAAGPKVIVPFMEKVARAVHYAHGQNVLHRDLKPANILVEWRAGGNKAPVPRVADFGLAKLLSAEVDPEPEAGAGAQASPEPQAPGADVSRLTAPDYQPGTPAYMAPEQFDPAFGAVGPATDVWALGVVLFELLTGARPFQGETRAMLSAAVRGESPVPPRQRQLRLHRGLEAIVLRCLAKDPQERYPTAEALADALSHFHQRRRRLRRRLVAGAGVLSVAAAVLALVFFRQPSDALDRTGSGDEQAHAEFEAQTAPLLKRLGRGEPVELIPAHGERQAKIRFFARDGSVGAVENAEGLRVRGDGYAHFLEMLPAIPLTHYRITAKVRFEASLGEDRQWGVYYRYDQGRSTRGLQRYYHALIVAEQKPLAQSLAHGETHWSYHVNLSPHLFAELLPPADQVLRDERWLRPNVTNFVHRKLPTEPSAKAWRTLAIEVSPTSTSASCTDSAGRFHLTPLPRAVDDPFLKDLRGRHEDLAAIPWFPQHGSAVGISLRASICTIGSFRVVKLDPAGR
jgi:serine/threonine protein kinase